MAGITNISFLTRPVQGYDNGGEIVNPNTAAQDLGISDSLTQDTITTFKPAQYLKNLVDQQVERIGPENLQDMSNRVTNRAVGEVSDRIAQTLKNKGYKISFDWKGFTNWMLGKDAQGNPKPFKSAKENRQAVKNFIDKTPAGGARKIIIREGLNLVNQIAPNLFDTVKDAWSELTSTDERTSVGEKVISKVDEFKNKQKLLKEAYKDKEVLKLNKILPNFAKLTEDEKYEAAVSFVNILNSPSKKLALYDLQRKIAQGTKKTGRPTGVDSVAAYANKKNMIPEGLMGKSSKETVQFEPKAMRSNQEVIDVFNNLKKWKSSKAGKLDPTGRSLTGTNLDEIMNIGELTPKKRQDIIRILRDDLDSIGLTDISRPGKIKIPKNKSAQKLLEEMNLTTFPKDFQFATSGLLTTPQKIQYNKIIASLDSAVQAKGLKVGVGTDFGTKNIGNRMLRQAFQNDIPLTEIFKKLEKVDIDGVADIIKRRNMYNKKIQEFIKLGYDVDKAEIGHITAIAEDALLALDLDNLVLQAAKANRKETGLRNKIKNILNNPEKSPYKMEEVIKELEDLGIETKVGDNIYGKAKDIEKELRNLEIGASDAIFGIPYSKGGIVGIDHLTRPL